MIFKWLLTDYVTCEFFKTKLYEWCEHSTINSF